MFLGERIYCSRSCTSDGLVWSVALSGAEEGLCVAGYRSAWFCLYAGEVELLLERVMCGDDAGGKDRRAVIDCVTAEGDGGEQRSYPTPSFIMLHVVAALFIS